MATRNRTDGPRGTVRRDPRSGRVELRGARGPAQSNAGKVEYAEDNVVREIGERATKKWAGLLDRLSE